MNESSLNRGLTRIAIPLFVGGTIYAGWRALQGPSTLSLFAVQATAAVTAGVIAHYVLNRRAANVPRQSSSISESGRTVVFGLVSAAFVITLSLAILVLHSSRYVADWIFYPLLGIACGLIAINIGINGEQREGTLLAQVFALAILAKLYFFVLNPYVYTSDDFIQYSGVQQIGLTRHVPESLGHYFYFPGFVVFATSWVMVTSLPTELIAISNYVSVLAIVPLAFVYGRQVAGRSVGLYAALFMVFTVFAFLPSHASAALFGLSFILLALLSLGRMQKGNLWAWLPVFWLAAFAAFFSHPINALVLAIALVVRHGVKRYWTQDPRQDVSPITPFLSYAVIYAAYLAFIAFTSFSVLVTAVFIAGYVPPLATSPTRELEANPMYVLQSAIASSSMAILLFLATFGTLLQKHVIRFEHLFLATLGVVFIIIPAAEFALGSFRIQSSRFLVYMTLPIVLLAAHGLVSLRRHAGSHRKFVTLVAVLAVSLGFLASSSYLAHNDIRFLYPDVPAVKTHITDSARSSRDFLGYVPSGSVIYMDLGSFTYFHDSQRAAYGISGSTTIVLDELTESNNWVFVLVNTEFLRYGNPYTSRFIDWGDMENANNDSATSLLFDNGPARVYYRG